MKQIINKMLLSPQKLFLIDGIGAMLSAFLLGVVLIKLEWLFGIPSSILYLLAAFPLFFAVYDYYSYQQSSSIQKKLLKGIALLNILYCCLSIGLTVYHQAVITYWGWIYIIFEVIIVMVLAFLELKVASGAR